MGISAESSFIPIEEKLPLTNGLTPIVEIHTGCNTSLPTMALLAIRSKEEQAKSFGWGSSSVGLLMIIMDGVNKKLSNRGHMFWRNDHSNQNHSLIQTFICLKVFYYILGCKMQINIELFKWIHLFYRESESRFWR